jgi:CPA2 family monovalent cation:H+ antiporter-2
MDSIYSLPDVLIILAAAIAIVAVFRKINISPVIGYLVAGAIIGPYGLNLVGYNNTTKSLAEFGIVFLLFSIGLELTLERLISMRRLIFGLGILQFFITAVAISSIVHFIYNDINLAIVIGSSLALSSTAIVLKLLSELRENAGNIKKISISVLLLQDLIVVPLFILIPLLNKPNVEILPVVLLTIVKSIGALTIIVLAGRFLLRPLFKFIASSHYNDIFVATTLFVVLGSAWVTQNLGLSLAFGAFIAGVIVAETEFRHHVESTISQFKGLFLGFFFMTEIGMHFDLTLISEKLWMILLFSILLILLKALIIFVICLAFKFKIGTSINAALLISQSGEFAFVLFEMASKESILSADLLHILSLVVATSMALTPLLALFGRKLERYFDSTKSVKTDPPKLTNHFIIAGFGRVGQTVSTILDAENISYMAIDTNHNVVSKYHKKNKPVYYGDITDMRILESIQTDQAGAIVLAMTNVKALTKTVKIINNHFPHVPIIVRAQGIEHSEKLKKLGAQIIVPEIYELGLQMSTELLKLSGVPREEIEQLVQSFRQSNQKPLNLK